MACSTTNLFVLIKLVSIALWPKNWTISEKFLHYLAATRTKFFIRKNCIMNSGLLLFQHFNFTIDDLHFSPCVLSLKVMRGLRILSQTFQLQITLLKEIFDILNTAKTF